MTDPERATEIVHQAVEALRLRGRVSRASAEVLGRLAATAGPVKAGGKTSGPVPPVARVGTSPAGGARADFGGASTNRTSRPGVPAGQTAGAAKPAAERAGDLAASVPNFEAPSIARRDAVAEGEASVAPGPKIDPARVAEVPPAGFSPDPRATKLAPATGTKAERLAAMRGPVLACTKCPHMVKARTQVVFGVGNPEAELMFVGEAPGADEDLVGEPFVGRAGQLLTRIIETMGFRRSDVFIANVLKCRPNMPPGESGNRKPTGEEMNTCKPYLLEQIGIIQPKVLVALGGTAMEGLLGIDKFFVTRQRGEWHEFAGIPLMPTFHPSYLLRNQSLTEKRKTWEDMLAVLEKLGREISEKQRGYFLKA